LNFAWIAAFSSGVPSTLVYLVSSRHIAAVAASLMLPGVSKSGSPMVSPMISRPCARSSRTRCAPALLAETVMRETRGAKKPFGMSLITYHSSLITRI
jgi:hypothetical protein